MKLAGLKGYTTVTAVKKHVLDHFFLMTLTVTFLTIKGHAHVDNNCLSFKHLRDDHQAAKNAQNKNNKNFFFYKIFCLIF